MKLLFFLPNWWPIITLAVFVLEEGLAIMMEAARLEDPASHGQCYMSVIRNLQSRS
jgi:hypothetical protein